MNLISPSTLDALGYSIMIDIGKMRVIKGSLIALKVVRVNGFYVLHDLTIDSKRVASVVQSLDCAMLWNRRLWHISEKGLSTFS